MKILILGNSSIFKRKIYPALKKFKEIEIEIASKRHVKSKFKITKSYKSYSIALKKTSAKIVYISLINSKHYNWAFKALTQNMHVIIDKPLTTNFNDAKKLISLAIKKKLLLSEAIVFKEDSRFKKVIEKINLNKTIKIYSKFHIPKLENKNFRNFKRYGGGCFHDMSSYAAYLILCFFKNKTYSIIKKKTKDGFKIQIQSKKVYLNASFAFNEDYKNEIFVHNNSKIYYINYAFSPPIDQNLNLQIFNILKQKKNNISFIKQNVFYPYFNGLFKIISQNKYNFSYNEIKKILQIKKKIS